MIVLALLPAGHPWTLYVIAAAFVGLGIWSFWTGR